MFGKATIAGRLVLAFGTFLLLLVFVVALGLDRLSVLNAMVTRIVEKEWQQTVLASQMFDLMNEQARDTFLLFHGTDQDAITRQITMRVDEIAMLLDRLRAEVAHPEARALVDEITERRAHYVDSFLTVVALLAEGRHDDAAREMASRVVPALERVFASTQALTEVQRGLLAETGSTSLATLQRARETLLISLAAALLAALLLAVWIVRAVTRPLGGEPEDVRVVVEQIAAGNLDGEIRLRHGDKDSLLAAMRKMQGNLRELIDVRQRAEDACRESQQRLQDLIETQRDWVWEVDADWRYSYVGPQVRELLGIEPDELLGRTPFDLMPADEALRVRGIADACRAGLKPIVALENVNLHKDGHTVVLETSGRPYCDRQGRFAGYRGLDREITGRKQAEEARLAEAVRLRDALVREVHHRIKNNLQTVIGLLRREPVRHPEARQAIETAIARVRAVAVVHGLYGRTTRHHVMLCELLPAVLGSVVELSGTPITQEGIQPDQGNLTIQVNETVAVALILNELITNAVKHTGAGDGQAVPGVTLTQESDQAFIRIINAGRLPQDFDFSSGRGLGTGLGLVRALMPRHGMSIGFRQDNGLVQVELRITEPVLSGRLVAN